MKSCPYVHNICVCGGTYSNELTALVSPNHKNLLKLAQDMGLKGAQIPDLCNNSEVNKRVYESIVKTGQSSNINKKEIPVRIRLVPEEWTPDNDMLTAAIKMKRKNVENRYHKEIQSLFNNNNNNNNSLTLTKEHLF
jgi:long-chain acyl-CoA synthetase